MHRQKGDITDATGAGGKAPIWKESDVFVVPYSEVRGTKIGVGWGCLVYQPLALPLQG